LDISLILYLPISPLYLLSLYVLPLSPIILLSPYLSLSLIDEGNENKKTRTLSLSNWKGKGKIGKLGKGFN